MTNLCVCDPETHHMYMCTLTYFTPFTFVLTQSFRVMTKKMDFSNIKVKLVTSDGVLKSTTECAPNGYYFLPIYDKGKFAIQLEGPQGWSFGK